MARVAIVKKDDKPVAAKVTVGRGMGRGPRDGTGPRAQAGLCPRTNAIDQINSAVCKG